MDFAPADVYGGPMWWPALTDALTTVAANKGVEVNIVKLSKFLAPSQC